MKADPPNAPRPRLGPLLLAVALVGIIAGFGSEALHEKAGVPRWAAGLFAGAVIVCAAPLAR